MLRQKLLCSCGVVAMLGLASPVLAQGAGTPTQGAAPSAADNTNGASASASESAGALAEVVVTANKRAENIQSVAAGIAAVGTAVLERQGFKDVTDLSRVVPEVRVATGQYTNITIRGVRTSNVGPSTDSPNAVHLDGVYQARFTSLPGLFFDVQRIEVLQGPQGTLYGRNSAGGTVNIISNKPTQEFGGNASFDYGNYDSITATAAVNVPLTSKLAMRAAFWHNAHKGYNSNGTDDADQNSGRVSFLWKPTSNDSLLVTGDREQVGGKGGAGATIPTRIIKLPTVVAGQCGAAYLCYSNQAAAGAVGTTIPIQSDSSNPRNQLAYTGPLDLQTQRVRGGGVMGQYDHDFGWANLTAQASYRTSFSHNTTGSNTTPQDARLQTLGFPNARPLGIGGNDADSHWNSQEIRLTSPSNQAFTYVAGLYRFNEHSFGNHLITDVVAWPNTSAATVGQAIITQPLKINSDTANTLNDDTSYAGFAQGTFTPPSVPMLHLTAGIRYNDEKKHGVGYQIQNTALVTGSNFDITKRWTATTYKLNAAFDITPRNLIYVDHSTGFKSGGFAFGATPVYEPEKNSAWEIGSKNRFLDNRLQVNFAAWHYDYTNLITASFDFFLDLSSTPPRPGTILNTSNAPKTSIDGQSLDVQASITNDDIFTFNGAHVVDRFKQYNLVSHAAFARSIGIIQGATDADFDYAGALIPNVPPWTFNSTYDHIFHLAGGELDAQAALHFTSRTLYGANQIALADVNNYRFAPAQWTEDVSLRFQPESRRWAITGYVRNLTNHDVIVNQGYTSNQQFLAASDPRVQYAYETTTYGNPRTFGVIVSADF